MFLIRQTQIIPNYVSIFLVMMFYLNHFHVIFLDDVVCRSVYRRISQKTYQPKSAGKMADFEISDSLFLPEFKSNVCLLLVRFYLQGIVCIW